MIITLDQAGAIVDGVPGDTVVWNCWSAEDMLRVAAECDTAEDLVEVICSLEEGEADRMLGCQDWGDAPSNAKLDAKIEASNARLASLRKRVADVVAANVG